MKSFRRNHWLWQSGLALVLAAGGMAWAADSSEKTVNHSDEKDLVAERVHQAIAALDDEAFAIREQGAKRLQALVDEPRWSSFLSDEFNKVLLSSDTSFEVRACLELLIRQLPPTALTTNPVVPTAAEIIPLLDRLHDDSSVERDRAQRRLQWMFSRVELIEPLWTELKRRAAAPQLSASMRRELEPLLDRAREAWLLADPARVPMPAVASEQIVRWMDALAQLDDSRPAERFRRQMAEHELFDAMAREDTRPRALELLERRIVSVPDAATSMTLRHIADFAKPAMAAEVWSNHTHLIVQYLIIGVPQFNEMAPRATHFDRIDEATAHCVSGNVLSEGNYPVRLAIPHPQGSEYMYYLTNLPSPRRRLIYESQLKRSAASRLREISQRTLDRFLDQRAGLSEMQVLMLGQLDPQLVSRFVGPYFQAAPNEPLVTVMSELANQSSVQGAICYMMARVGTHEAVPALEQLARSEKLGEPTFENPYRIAWIAALAIARRDPWPEVDAWLAKLIDEEKPLMINGDSPPELGASAAGFLLERHGVAPRSLGLETAGENAADRFHLMGYRFTSMRSRQEVKRWWEKQSKSAGSPAASAP